MKNIFIVIINVCSYYYVFLSKIVGFYNVSLILSKHTIFGDMLRNSFYAKTMKKVGVNVKFSYGVIFSHSDITIGDNVRFGPYNTIGLVDFEDDVLIGQYVHFLSGKEQHKFDDLSTPINQQKGIQNRLLIEKDCWIGAGTIVLDSIGKKSVIGAGSVVTKRIENYSVAVGNPAKTIKKRNE